MDAPSSGRMRLRLQFVVVVVVVVVVDVVVCVPLGVYEPAKFPTNNLILPA